MSLDGFSFSTCFWSVCLSVWYRAGTPGISPDYCMYRVWALPTLTAKQDYKMVCTQDLYHQSVKYDRLGELSPEKDCLWWHWCFDNLSGSHQRVLDSDDDFRSCCWNVSQCNHKQSFSGIHLPRQSYFTDLRKTRGWKHSETLVPFFISIFQK